ncbi:MAG: hypothetical protein ABS42_00355 [Bdellovibrio sp. SCN 50-8]|nr:MAG: hypothetical protein ABS42_00355 [Bdellovibrio sp. SCN 50-8]
MYRLGLIFIAAAFIGLLGGCESLPGSKTERIEDALEKAVYQRVYFASFESVWRAAQLALKYPISTNNMDNGVLETEWVRALEGFSVPGTSKSPSSGIRYKISVTMVKGRMNGRESVRVTLRKSMERQRDFFSDPELILTDGVEEKVILYRIERELIIQDALGKVAGE